jgi:hypothetical protein
MLDKKIKEFEKKDEKSVIELIKSLSKNEMKIPKKINPKENSISKEDTKETEVIRKKTIDEKLDDKLSEDTEEDAIDDTIDDKSKKKTRVSAMDAYMNLFTRINYEGGPIEYIMPKITVFNGFMLASNVKQNSEIYNGSSNAVSLTGTEDIVNFKLVETYAKTISLNGMTGKWQYQDVSMEEKDRMNAWILNPTNKVKYLLQSTLLGIGAAGMDADIKRTSLYSAK